MRSLCALPTTLLVFLSAATTSLAKVPVPAESDAPHELGINIINPVTCSRPSQNGDTIRMHYRGRLLSTGAEFDSSYKRNKPFAFQLGKGQVIQGWDQGLLNMCPGEARELTIPPELGYGNRGVGSIPAGSTLVFDTTMVGIMGVTEEDVVTHTRAATSMVAETSSTTEQMFGIATAPATKPEAVESAPTATPTFVPIAEDKSPGDSSPKQMEENESGECRLLGAFALLVQGALGATALLTLVWKRFRETPKRPWKVWFFDVSKQVLGSILLHVLNLAMSTMGSTDLANQAAAAGSKTVDAAGRKPNPCSFYLLNLAIDVSL